MISKTRKKVSKTLKNKPTKPSYCCKICDYTPSRACDFKKHINTKKHRKKLFVLGESDQKQEIFGKYFCEVCKIPFGSKTTLWRHNKKCYKKNESQSDNENTTKWNKTVSKTLICEKMKQNISKNHNVDISENCESKNPENYFMNKFIDAQQKNIEAQNQIITLLTEKNNTQQLNQTPVNNLNNCLNTNNTNNNNITINMYLNDYCKDAMNLEDFINKVKLTVQDVVDTANNGYVSSMSNIVIRELENIPTQKRPIHCTDENRGNFYVKDDNEWKKDKKNVKMKGLLHKVSIKNRDQFKEWQYQNPNYKKDESKFKTCNKMMMNMFGGTSEEMVKKNKTKSMKEIGKSINIKEAINEIIKKNDV